MLIFHCICLCLIKFWCRINSELWTLHFIESICLFNEHACLSLYLLMLCCMILSFIVSACVLILYLKVSLYLFVFHCICLYFIVSVCISLYLLIFCCFYLSLCRSVCLHLCLSVVVFACLVSSNLASTSVHVHNHSIINLSVRSHSIRSGWEKVRNRKTRIVLYLSIYIAPLNSHGQTEALLVRWAPRKETSFKKWLGRRKIG